MGGARDAFRRIESVFRYAWRHDDAQHAALHHGIEAFGAIVPHEALPERFRAQRYPQMEQIIATERARLACRRRARPASAPRARHPCSLCGWSSMGCVCSKMGPFHGKRQQRLRSQTRSAVPRRAMRLLDVGVQGGT